MPTIFLFAWLGLNPDYAPAIQYLKCVHIVENPCDIYKRPMINCLLGTKAQTCGIASLPRATYCRHFNREKNPSTPFLPY